jgi:hypothetical protein
MRRRLGQQRIHRWRRDDGRVERRFQRLRRGEWQLSQWFGRWREHDRRGDDRGDDHHHDQSDRARLTGGLQPVPDCGADEVPRSSTREGPATPDAYQKVFTDWDVYDGTIQKKNPQAWQTMTDALTAMQNAVTAKDVAAANAAAAAFEAASNAYLASG